MEAIQHETEHEPIENFDQQRSDEESQKQLTGCAATACCNPHRTCHRFIILAFICFSGFSGSFCYDGPSALHDHFKKDLNLSTTKFSMLFSIHSWPSVVLSFVGGFMVDRFFGIQFGTILYGIIMTLGQIIFAIGGTINEFWVMMLGRFIFGMGAESLAVAESKYAVRWFKDRELNTAFGLQLSFNRVESTICFLLMEPIYQEAKKYFQGSHVIGAVLFISLFSCIIAMTSSNILRLLDRRADKILKRNKSPTGDVVKLSDIKTFSLKFWMVCLTCVSYYVTVYPFIALGKAFFEERFQYTPDEANRINSTIYLISAFVCPLFGIMVDKTGRNLSWMFGATLITILSHILLAFTSVTPYIGICAIALAFSVWASSLWPLVAFIIPEHKLGTAFGLCYSVLNLGFAVVLMFTGMIVDYAGYTMLEVFFIMWLSVALIAISIVWILDSKTGGYLNMTPDGRKAFDTSSKKEENNLDWIAKLRDFIRTKVNIKCQ